MKKSTKPVIFFIITLMVMLTAVVLTSQGVKLKYEELVREKAQLEVELKSEQTKNVNLIADYQMLTSEDIIKNFALNQMNMVESDKQLSKKIIIQKEEVEEIKEKLGKLHD